MIGFLVPAVDSKKPLYEFVVPVDEIEKMTGIDFYPSLNDKIENSLEKLLSIFHARASTARRKLPYD